MYKLNQNAIEVIKNFIARNKDFSTADRTLLRVFTDATNNIENNVKAEISPTALVKESQDLMHELLLRIAKNAKDNKKQNVLLALSQTQNTQQFFNPYLFAELENSANRFNNPAMMLVLDNCQHHMADDRKVQAHLKKYLENGATLNEAKQILFNFELKQNTKGVIVAKEISANLKNLGAYETAHILKAQNRKPQQKTAEVIEAKEVFASSIIDADAHIEQKPAKQRRIFGRRMNSEFAKPTPHNKVETPKSMPRKPISPIMDADKVQREKFEVSQGEKTPIIVAKENPNIVDRNLQRQRRHDGTEFKRHLHTQHELFE